MKEIKYNSNLLNDVENGCKTKVGCFFEYLAIIMYILSGFGIMIGLSSVALFENKLSLIIVALATSFMIAIGGLTIISEIKAKRNLNQLANKIKSENEIDVSVKELTKTMDIVRRTTTVDKIFEEKKISKEKKMIEYFSFLDKNDQIQILKQIRTNLNEQNQLFLLEDSDLEKKQFQLIKDNKKAR